jgi:hypothetical protein
MEIKFSKSAIKVFVISFGIVFFNFSCKKENVDFVSSDDLKPWSLYASSNSTDLNLFPILDDDIFIERIDLIKYGRDGLIEINKTNLKFSAYVLTAQSSPLLLSNENGQEYFTWNNRNVYFDSSIVDLISNDEIVLRFANLVNQITNTNTNTSTSTNTTNTIISNSWEFRFFK